MTWIMEFKSLGRVRKMKKFKIYALLVLVVIGFFNPVRASADVGPKPSVTIVVKGGNPENEVYITLLSKTSRYGPYSAKESYENEISKKFSEFKDEDGYFYIDNHYKLKDGKMHWSYYPPNDFKVLMYVPATDSYIVSETPLKTFAFKTFYNVSIPFEISNANGNTIIVNPVRSYNIGQEALGLSLRILLTIAVELAIALLFGFKHRKQLKTIALTNVLTQGLLNVLLFAVLYFLGGLLFVLAYIVLEIVVFVIEAFIYMAKLKTADEKPVGTFTVWFYSFVANALSLIVGIILTGYIPGMF